MLKNEIKQFIKNTEKSIATYGGMVSFAIPAFGELNIDSLYLAISSINRQSYPNKEVIVAEEYLNNPKFRDVACDTKAKYVGYDISGLGGAFSISRVRNAALVNAEGEYVVMQDADVVIQHETFLNDLISKMSLNPSSFFISPLLRHLQTKEIKKWVDDFKDTGNIYNYLHRCKVVKGYILSIYPYDENEFIVVTHPFDASKRDRHYVALKKKYRVYKSKRQMWAGSEPLIFTPCVGKYFIAAKKMHFLSAGGYCEEFIGWGGEDGDLKWKLSNFLDCKSLQLDDRFAQIHLNHDRPYFQKEHYQNVKDLSKQRIEKGFQECLKSDLSKSSFFCKHFICTDIRDRMVVY